MRIGKRTVQSLTGQVQQLTFNQLQNKFNQIKNKRVFKNRAQSSYQRFDMSSRQISKQDNQGDTMSTKFNQKLPQLPQKPKFLLKKSDKNINQNLKRPLTAQKRNLRYRTIQPVKQMTKDYKEQSNQINQTQKIENQNINIRNALLFHEQMKIFQTLYQHLANILGSIPYGLSSVQSAINEYLKLIQGGKLAFIDDFLQGKDKKLRKVVREGRIVEGISIAYLFLQLAQQRIQDNQSYLTNFIGYCLSNVLLTARAYHLKQNRQQFEQNSFQKLLKTAQLQSFNQVLTNFKQVLFRVQHNNQIISMMQRRLGKINPKFQSCLQLFLKQAQKNNILCSQCTHYIFQYLALHIHEQQLVGISPTLQLAPSPYCRPSRKPYTLIIQPIGILINKQKSRSFLNKFLQWAHKNFQIIMWTWQMPYSEQILLFQQKYDMYLTSKLYRHHCKLQNSVWLKDLSRIGHPIPRTLIIDFDHRIYYKQPKNGIQMRWKGNKQKGLFYLCQILQQLLSSEGLVEDMIKIYAQQLFQIRGF